LVTLGQWSLSYYLLHQPVLMGLVGAFVWLRGS
jgi:peptidoglycan/LPS O-acetylase OafA/YrhL